MQFQRPVDFEDLALRRLASLPLVSACRGFVFERLTKVYVEIGRFVLPKSVALVQMAPMLRVSSPIAENWVKGHNSGFT
jgi:hypothetical protein